jgi:hypothetical protein
LRPTENTKVVWKILLQHQSFIIASFQDQGVIGDLGNEQAVLNTILSKSKGMEVSWLPHDTFVCGKCFDSEKTRPVDPVVVLNNHIIGNKAKFSRAKLWNHWYLDNDGKRCIEPERT